jgi:hypothetical protein
MPGLVGERKNKVLDSCKHLRRALRKWETEIGPEIKRFDYTAAASAHLKPPSTDREVPLLHLSTLFWALSLSVHSSLENLAVLHGPLAGNDGQDGSENKYLLSIPPAAGHKSMQDNDTSIQKPRQYALKIAHAIPLLFERESGAFGCNVALFPLLSSWRFFSTTEPADNPSAEHRIILNLFSKEYQGTSVGRYAACLKREVWESNVAGV